jgi:hypothetical protein
MTAADFDIDVFGSGWHRGEFWSVDDLDEICGNNRLLADVMQPTLKLGHADKQVLDEDLGHIAALWRVGTKLRATIRGMPQRLFELLQRGRYRRCSSEIYPAFEKSTQARQLQSGVVGKVLTAVALLGSDVPEVKDLQDLVSPLRARTSDAVLCMSEHPIVLEKENTVNHVSFAESRREVRRFIESHPELYNGSEQVHFTTDPQVAEFDFLVASLREACHEAARDIAARYGLDMRQRADYAECYRLLASEDPSWSSENFDEMSAAAQNRLLAVARRRMRTHTHGGFYGRPAARGHQAMLDEYAQARHAHMLAIAKRDNLDLSTVDGRTVAYQRVADEHPHLRIPVGRGRVHAADLRHIGIMPVAGMNRPFDDQFSQYRLRRGQGSVGNPVGYPGDFSEHDYRKPSTPPAATGTNGAGGVGGRNF